jgi:hypothetical protein
LTPVGEISVAEMSPPHACAVPKVILTRISVNAVDVSPVALNVILSGAPGPGHVEFVPSAMAPTPEPVNVAE